MPFSHMAVICTLDRVGPLDIEGARGFGLNLSASFVPDAAGQALTEAHLALLETWRWKISKVILWRRSGGAWTRIPGEIDVLSPPAVAGLPDADPLAVAVRDRISRVAKPAGAFEEARLLWNPAAAQTGEEDPVHVRNLLATLSTRSAPAPHRLGLSFLLRVPEGELPADVDEVAAVPLFGDGALGERGPEDPDNQIPADAGNGVLSVRYEAGDPPLMAYLLSARAAVADHSEMLLDLETGWVKPHGGWAGTDWTVAFERRAAEAFDLGQRLIDALREGLASPAFREKLAGRGLRSFRDAVVAAARDLAGLGLETAPDGTSLLSESERAPVEAHLQAFAPELSAWREIVLSALPELRGVAAIGAPESPRPPEHLEEEVAELDRLQSAFADDANLRRLVAAQWRVALAAAPAADREPVLRLLDQRLGDSSSSPRRRLAHQSLGSVWPALVSLDRTPPPAEGEPARPREPEERDELPKRLGEQLRGAFRFRLLNPASPRRPHLSPDARTDLGTMAPEILASLTAFSERLANDLLPALGGDPAEGDGAPTPVPHGVTLQLDRVGTDGDPAVPDEDRKDLQHLLAGFGILMRRQGGDWRCLNLAQVVLEESGAEIAAAVPAPYRLGYRNGLRESAATYDNHPLVARSPAVDLAGDVTLSEENDADDPLWTPLVRHEAVLPPEVVGTSFSEWARLPALRFGDRYEALPYAVSNAGVLPRGLGRDDDPTRLRDFRGADLPAGNVRAFRYLRRVPVGPPRYGQAEADARKSELIPIPASVAPLAREIDVPETGEGERLPLLLLAPQAMGGNRHEFHFDVRKPAVDLKTWDRWVARDETLRDLRIDVWTWFHDNAPTELSQESTTDLTIDDPGAADLLFAELRPLHAPAGATPKTGVASIRRAAGFLGQIQSDPAAVSFTTGAVRLETGPSRISVTVPEGEVWELRLSALVEARLFSDPGERRFHSELGQGLPEVSHDGKTYRLQPSTFRLLVEVATDGLRGDGLSERLWRALAPESLGSRIVLRLDKDKEPGFPWTWISRVEIRRQVWRWNGRPPGRFPFGANPDGPEVLAWEAKAFAEREDADCARTSAVTTVPPRRPVLFEEERAGDARALLYRFGAEVFSRYEGLGTHRSSVRAEHVLEGEVKTPWRRLLHLCRWTGEVPKPRVKLVVPLTQARPADLPDVAAPSTPCELPAQAHGAAGLLVVLNEPWYEVGGLAEELGVALARVEDPILGRDRPEIGPDPILTGGGWGDEASNREIELRLDGPVGHTFDTDSSAPLFVSTSFVLPPPRLLERVKGRDLSWHFAKVRFQRRLVKEGLAGGPAEDRVSKPTDPYWVQFLPDASSYRMRTIAGEERQHLRIEDLALRVPGTGGPFDLIARERNERVRIEGRTPDAGNNRFIQALLVTRLIHDARGIEEEKYVGLYEIDGGTWRALDGPAAIGDPRLRARVVEIQERKGAETSEGADAKVWNRLFPGQDANGLPQDAVLRIVRVSPPIET